MHMHSPNIIQSIFQQNKYVINDASLIINESKTYIFFLKDLISIISEGTSPNG